MGKLYDFTFIYDRIEPIRENDEYQGLRAFLFVNYESMRGIKMKHFGNVLSEIVMPDLETTETESSLELNFIIGKIKHTVRRIKKMNRKNFCFHTPSSNFFPIMIL